MKVDAGHCNCTERLIPDSICKQSRGNVSRGEAVPKVSHVCYNATTTSCHVQMPVQIMLACWQMVSDTTACAKRFNGYLAITV